MTPKLRRPSGRRVADQLRLKVLKLSSFLDEADRRLRLRNLRILFAGRVAKDIRLKIGRSAPRETVSPPDDRPIPPSGDLHLRPK
jgi:hypothetical protein